MKYVCQFPLDFIFILFKTVYYDVPAPIVKNDSTVSSRADPDEDGVIDLIMKFSERFGASRLFEIRVTQIPFSQRAPAGCLQYFTSLQGIIQVKFGGDI